MSRWSAGSRGQRAVDLLTVGVAVSTAAALLLLLRSLPAWQPPVLRRTPASAAATSAPAGRGNLTVIWQRDLRQPLVDPVIKPVEAAPEPSPAIRLVGTAVENGRQYGVFQMPSNSLVVRAAGQRVEGYDIVAIRRGWAQLRSAGRSYELTVPWYERIRAAEASHAP